MYVKQISIKTKKINPVTNHLQEKTISTEFLYFEE